MTSPTPTEPPDLIDSVGDLWIYVTDMGGEGVDPMYYLIGRVEGYTDPDEIERLRAAEQDDLSMWAYERYEWVRDAHGPITERPRGPVPEPAPDLIDSVGDHWVCVGDRDGAPRYVCIGRDERVHEDGWREAQRVDAVGRYGGWPTVGMTRAEIVAEWHSVTERPRTAPEPTPEPEPVAPHAEVLEPDLETDNHVWVYTGHDDDGVRRYRAMDKRGDGTLRHPDFDSPGDRFASVSDVEQVRRWCSDGHYWLHSCDVEGYILLNGRGHYDSREGAEDGEVRERPRTVRLDVVDDRTPADRRRALAGGQSAPEPEPEPAPEPAPVPEGRVTGAGGFALDGEGLPVDPGPDHPAEVRLAAIQARTEAVQARHEQFRRDTRAEVLAAQNRNGWCQPGTTRVLEDLGLDKINAVRRVTATVSFEISGTNSDQNATTFARNKIDRAIREALGDRLRGDLSVDPGRVVVTRHED